MPRIINFLRFLTDKVTGRLLSPVDLCIAHEFHQPPYGGGNQFCMALANELAGRCLKIRRGLAPVRARACLFNSFNFDMGRLCRLRGQFGRMVHRVDGPVDVYRGNQQLKIDRRINEINKMMAGFTVFQSVYSLNKHRELGLEFVRPTVIPNAVDPEVFNSKGRIPWDPERKTRLITVNWSDNPNKGGALFQQMERILDWNKYEWIHLGRTKLTYEHIKAVPPVGSREVASYLRNSDIMVTASLHESCSNAILEALACGLPVAYIKSGSNSELVQEAGLSFSIPEEAVECLHSITERWHEFTAKIRFQGIAEVADKYEEILFNSSVSMKSQHSNHLLG